MTSQFEGTVVIAAANNWDGVRMADRQLAERLTNHYPVLYVDPPSSVASRIRATGIAGLRSGHRLQRLGPRLARLTPEALPGLTRPAVAAVNGRIVAHQVRKALRTMGGTARATIEANVLSPIMGHCGESTKIYWAQDDFVGMAPLVGIPPQLYQRAEHELSRDADLIIAANPSVSAGLVAEGYTPNLIPFGCDFDLFATAATAKPAEDVKLSGPIAVFIGHLGDRIDIAILERVAQTGISLLLVGPRHPRTHFEQFESIAARPNVQCTGEKAFEDLPSYLAHATVAILPYTHSRFNIGSFPLKTLEYLAAGLPVVATSLPAISWLNTRHIHVRDEPADFADAVVAIAAAGRDRHDVESRRHFAQLHSWDNRATQFADVIAKAQSPGERAR